MTCLARTHSAIRIQGQTLMEPLRIFIGYDSREPLAYHVCCHSILTKTSIPVSMTPLVLSSLRRIFTRERGPAESTEFTYSRFLVPYLSGYRGLSLFMDCDMLVRTDLLHMLVYHLADPHKAVWCCQHDYVPRDAVKFLGQVQTTYPRKNWSSLMLFNNDQCRALTPEYVNTATGAELHRFSWMPDSQIGSLPLEWNYLVGEDRQAPESPQVIHFTNGGPWFSEYAHVEYADEWKAVCDGMGGRLDGINTGVGNFGPASQAALVTG
jgi:hypothetical protein